MEKPIPAHWWRKFRGKGTEIIPKVGQVKFGHLRRVAPISPHFGFERGLPVDRYYIEGFLARYASDVRGHVLEVGDDTYTQRFGGNRVTVRDVFDVEAKDPRARIIGDLANASHVSPSLFDCIILTQTLQYVYDVRGAVGTIYRVLKPGGIALLTLPCITARDTNWIECWYWGFTNVSAQLLLEDVFPPANVKVETHGSVLAGTAFLQGLATEELKKEELDYLDPNYQVLIAVRAAKPETKL